MIGLISIRTPSSDEALMAAYRAGDKNAFQELYARVGPRLYRFFMHAFHDPSLAEDLLQTTLLKLHRARSEFRIDQRLRPWVFAIAARVRADELRKRKNVPEPLDAESHLLSSSSAESPRDGRLGAVRSALAELPEPQRLIIHLHRVEGLTFAEIAAVLETSEAAVKLRAFRIYARLRKRLRRTLDVVTEEAS